MIVGHLRLTLSPGDVIGLKVPTQPFRPTQMAVGHLGLGLGGHQPFDPNVTYKNTNIRVTNLSCYKHSDTNLGFYLIL